MALPPTSRKLGLTRDQLAAFLDDHEQIKQFENLFSIVDSEVAPDAVTQATILAGNAQSSANEALAYIAGIVATLDLLALAPVAASEEQIAVLQEQITALQQMPPPKEFRTPRYGSFYDTTDQVAGFANTAYGFTYNTTDLSFGVYIGSPTSRVYADRPSVYNIQFSAQFINSAGGGHNAWIWLRKNGADIPYSATTVRVEGNNTELVAAWNFLLQMNAGDYFELMWEVSDTSLSLHADPATAIHPDIPSIILTVTDGISSLEV